MKLGGLFSGIGGFEEAWRRNGGQVAWMCEVDPKARQVLEARFPGVPIYADVTELDPAEVEPVDVLTGGSPCQGFSIAGGRAGLEHHESRLFADHVRIMNGLAERGLRWAVWENVPGVLSIKNGDGERTFPHVVGALAGSDEPAELREFDYGPRGGRRKVRWNAGVVDAGRRAVAWRVLDSRHFGVPQRRRRVYAVVAFGGAAADRAGRALLAQSEGVRGDSAACGQEGQDLAGTLGGGSGSRDWAPDTDRMTFVPDTPETAACLTAREGKGPDSDVTTTLIPQSFNWQQGDAEYSLADDAHTLGTTSAPAVLLTMREGKDGGGKGPLLAEDESLTLSTGNGQVLFDPEPAAYGVRRLTPVECERLQGFPDGWTEPAGSDSARYKALGNAVTVNVPEWLFSRILGTVPRLASHDAPSSEHHAAGGTR